MKPPLFKILFSVFVPNRTGMSTQQLLFILLHLHLQLFCYITATRLLRFLPVYLFFFSLPPYIMRITDNLDTDTIKFLRFSLCIHSVQHVARLNRNYDITTITK